MFNNLIESSSHRREFRRRGSFFLFTTASYALLFIIAGVVSIYAFDARMEDQNIELATIMPLIYPPAEIHREVTPTPERTAGDNSENVFVRKNLTATVDEPDVAPDVISSKPNPDLPRPRQGIVVLGPENIDPLGDGRAGSDTGGRNTVLASPNPVIAIPEPPPAPAPKPVPKVVRKNVVNGDALVLPKPIYPPLAKQMRVEGTVNVQVLIDEKGNVISATVVSGSPMLVHVARQVAYQARFSPTYLGDQPVKVSGVIMYNFVLQ